MAVTLRSGRELEERRNEKKEIEEKKHTGIGEKLKQQSSEVVEEDRTTKMQQEQQVEKGNLKKRLKLTILKFHSLRGCRSQSLKSNSLNS